MNTDASCQSTRAKIIRPAEKQSLMDYPWSSIALAYAVTHSKRKPWMDVATGLALAQCPDTVAGRRRYVQRLDERALHEQAETAGATMAEISECRRARDTFWDIQVPKMTALGDNH